MTRPLRQAHFRIWIVLPVLLYALLFAALAVRRSAMPANPAFNLERYR